MAIVTGTTVADRLKGTAAADAILGLDGDDALFGLDGDDMLQGGLGDDSLNGGTGADTMIGGLGDDSYTVDNAGDVITEAVGEGRDTVVAMVTYTLTAGAEIERFVARGAGAMDLTGNEFTNAIYGNDFANTITGGGGGDNLYGRGGDDILIGGAEADMLDGGTGADAMYGGAGDDLYLVDHVGDTVHELAGEGNDRVQATVSFVLGADSEVEQLSTRGTDAINLTGSNTANTITGNDAANTLDGLGGDDRINGRGGNDMLFGGDGNDTLIGGTGADTMAGGQGDDTYYVDDANDMVLEAAGDGVDTVLIDVSWTLLDGQHVEQLVARGNADINITGNDLANQISGNAGANILSGGGGDDVIYAGAGDTAIGGTGADTYIIVGGSTGDIRVIGEAEDTLTSALTGWQGSGTVVLGGLQLDRFSSGGLNLLVDAAVDTSSLQTAPLFGTAVTANGFIRQVINVTTLAPDRGFVIQGDAMGDLAGFSVSSAGDVNGDGLDDFIIGAKYGDDGGTYAGEAYVVFGSTNGFGTDVNGRQVLDLTTLGALEGFVIQGDAGLDKAGTSVSSAGDINGDGFDDIIVGAPETDGGGGNAGAAYVIYGSAATFGTAVGGRQVVDLTSLSASQGFIIQGDVSGDQLGRSVSSAGDVNGDGIDDIIVGAMFGDDGGSDASEAYVIFGKTTGFGSDSGGRQVLDLTGLAPADGFIIQGDSAGDRAGFSVSSAGDINGDGFDDIIVGAYLGDDAGSNAGEAYVIFGRAAGFGSPVYSAPFMRQVIDLTNLDPTQGFIVRGADADDRAGFSVSSAGDINGDGFDDFMVSAPSAQGGVYYNGEVYVIYGSSTPFGTAVGGRQVLDIANLTAAQGFIIQGDHAYDFVGRSVSAAGDVNGDGIGDIIVGAATGDDADLDSGEAYVIFGSKQGFGTNIGGQQVIDLAELTPAQGFIIQGSTEYDQAGQAVSGAGDINGDGFDDLIVGAPFGDDGGVNSGESYVIYGGPAGFNLPQIAGNGGNNSLMGTSASEVLLGGSGDDALDGRGGADVFLGGQGNDFINIGEGDFARIDGGHGVDVLFASGDLDFTLIDDALIKSIERIEIANGLAQTLAMDVRDVLAIEAQHSNFGGSTHDNLLLISGDADDTLYLTGFGSPVSSVSSGGVTYNLYELGGKVVLGVDSEMLVV